MKRLLVLALVLFGLMAGSAQASGYGVRLPRSEAIAMVKRTGGAVHTCKRLAPRRFTCTATYWREWHEGEEVEPGVVVETASGWESEEVTLSVGLYGVHGVPTLPVA